MGLALFTEAISDGLARIVFAHPGILVFDIEGHDLTQPRDCFLQGAHRGVEEVLQVAVLKRALFFAQPAFTGHGPLHIKAIRQIAVEHRTKAQFQHQQGMLDQKGAHLATIVVALLDFHEQGFDVGAFGMWAFARSGRIRGGIR